ncbi:MAG: DNA polymerase III subunit gamma/tau [Planctomycetota bacterium]|nr:MAG: DNA polymerase III subunit gamma/tau [Planctomycetota bacterium]
MSDAPPTSTVPEPANPGQYVVIARRYRPQSFDELIGQDHVRRAMAGAIESNRIGHAYLFTGARGVGKTSSARILAKSLNCIHGPTATPCNECEICRDISAGADVDVLEIDGASNRGVDEIRQLRQNVAVRPSRARFKIYIIDEVHMLTREAFNALLKTLEEPPEHVKFIFCTTEPEKVPITIHSRCQRFDFAGIPTAAIVDRLASICESEGINAERSALEIIARRAAGSMRDGQSLLEQVLSCCGTELTAEHLHRLLGTASGKRFEQLVACLVDRDAADSLAQLDGAVAEGADVGQLLEQLLGYFRDVMAAGVGCSAASFLHATSGDELRVKAAAQQLGLETVLAIMQIVDQTLARMRQSTHGRTLAEVAIVRICNLENLEDLATLAAAVRSGAVSAAPPGGQRLPPPRPTAAPLTSPSYEQKKNVVESSGNGQAATPSDEPSPAPAEPVELTAENVSAIWQQALDGITDMVADQAALADSVSLAAPRRVVVRFAWKYNSCKLSCERPDKAAILQRRLADVVGAPVQLEFAVDEPTNELAASARAAPSRPRTAERANHPFVRRAMELFGASSIRVDEPPS